jgi:hypothetical protein
MTTETTTVSPPVPAHTALIRRLSVLDARWFDLAFYAIWVVVLAYILFAFWGQTYDDVFLAFQYARNIERGDGFVFNIGEHFLGTPAPLFVLLLVIFHKILSFLTIPQISSIISGLGLAGTGMALYQMGRRYDQRLIGVIAAMLVIFNPLTLLVFGGETPLYLAFITTAIYCYLAERHALAAILLGLALMNRTEALVPMGILFCLYLLDRRRLPIRMIVISLTVLAPWLVYAFWEFGSPLTSSFTAKVSQVAAGAERYPFGLLHWLYNIILQQQPLFWAALPLMMLGLAGLIFTTRPWRIVVAWTVLQTVAYACLPIPFYHWYAAQIGVFAAVLIAVGAVELPRLLHRTALALAGGTTAILGRQWLHVRNIVLVLVVLTLPVTIYAHLLTARGYQKAWPHGPANALYQRTGEWFAAHTPPGSRIAYLEIGQIAFYSDRYIIDTLGLVTPGVAPYVAKSEWLWPMLRYKPDYIIYNPMFKDWTDSDAIFNQQWFKNGFRKVAEIEVPPYPFPLSIYQRQSGAIIPDPTE